MITLTTEQAQQIEEALVKIADLRNLGKIQPEVIAFETLYIFRAARAQGQIAYPERMDYPAIYPDENRQDQAKAYQYRKGWNDCLVRCKQAWQSVCVTHVEAATQEPVEFETEDGDLSRLLKLTVDIFNSSTGNHEMAVLWHEALSRVEAKLASTARTKDLTDDEILSIPYLGTGELKTSMVNFARAVIAADREKNK